MTTIFIGFSCIAALFVGWTLGPLGIWIVKKISHTADSLEETYESWVEKIETSAKLSEEKSKKDNKFYSTIGLPMFDENKKSKKGTRAELFLTVYIWTMLAFALISGDKVFWILFGLALFWVTKDGILEMLSNLIFGEAKKK